MSRDYKDPSNSKNSGKRGSLVLGLFIGYALGLISAMGIWMYMNQTQSPFITQERAADSATKSEPNPIIQKGGQVIGKDDKSAQTEDGKPRFEFYKILPGAVTEPAVDQKQTQQVAPQASSKDSYFIQAGSFQSAEDAENLKAKLAMMGLEASVQAVDLADRGTWHRVRVGPFAEIGEVSRVRSSLQQNGIQTSLVKVHEGAQ
ncbi:MAG: SPOR domain-containing protein [Nitrosomonadaceae bacterium]